MLYVLPFCFLDTDEHLGSRHENKTHLPTQRNATATLSHILQAFSTEDEEYTEEEQEHPVEQCYPLWGSQRTNNTL